MSAARDVDDTIQDLEWLADDGVGSIEAARRCNFASANAMYSWLRREGREDLLSRLRRHDPLGSAAEVTAPSKKSDEKKAADGIAAVISAAQKSTRKRTRNKADKASDLISELRDLVESERIEDEERAEVTAEVERLQRELAEARARLKGAANDKPSKGTTAPKGEYPCRNDGCDAMYDTPQGRSMHERRHCPNREQVAS